jgi:hypothetical protein
MLNASEGRAGRIYFRVSSRFFAENLPLVPIYLKGISEPLDMDGGELLVAKEQRRSNREIKKPKKPASAKKSALPSAPVAVERVPAKGGRRP